MARKRKLTNVQFTAFGWDGGPTCRIKIVLDRGKRGIDPTEIANIFVGARVECTLTFKEGDENEGGQQTFQPEIWTIEQVIGQCGSLSVKPETLEFSLNFMVEDVEPDSLAKFKKKAGTLEVKRVGDHQEEDPNQQKIEPEEEEQSEQAA